MHVWGLSLLIQRCEICMAISLVCMQEVWAPPIAWYSLGPALCGPCWAMHSYATGWCYQQDWSYSSEQLNAIKGKVIQPSLTTMQLYFETIKAVHSHCMMMCRRLWYIVLDSNWSNSLQVTYTDLYINGIAVKCLCWFFCLLQYLQLWASSKGFQLYVAHNVFPGIQDMAIFFYNCHKIVVHVVQWYVLLWGNENAHKINCLYVNSLV